MEEKSIYKIELYDDNCCPIADGTFSFFTDDIEEFQKRWFELEDFEDRKNRFLRSKAGEIVTDYYCDDEEFNIVQESISQIFAEKEIVLNKKHFVVYNVYEYGYSFYADRIKLVFRWIKFKNRYYRIVRYKAEGICRINLLGLNTTVICRGTGIIENNTPFVTDYRWITADRKAQENMDETETFNNASKCLDPNYTTIEDAQLEAFANNFIESICYVTNSYFKNELELKKDIETFEVTDEVLSEVFADVVGEA